jgi:hypothetical protein
LASFSIISNTTNPFWVSQPNEKRSTKPSASIIAQRIGIIAGGDGLSLGLAKIDLSPGTAYAGNFKVPQKVTSLKKVDEE